MENLNDHGSHEAFLVRSDYAPLTSDKDSKLFIRTVGDDFVSKKHLDLSDDELSRLALTEGAEMCRLYRWLHSNAEPDDSEEKKALSGERLGRIGSALARRLLSADYIFCLFNRITGRPHLFSRTFERNGSYVCSAPNIRIFTETYLPQARKIFPERFFELRKISKGQDGDGIAFFLADCFFLYGAFGVEIFGEFAALRSDMLVAPPDLSDMDEKDIPVMNPALSRWILLSAQMPDPTAEAEKLTASLYYKFTAAEAVKARFIVPVEAADGRDGSAVLELSSGEKYSVKTLNAKNHSRPAAAVFTDRKSMGERYGGAKFLSLKLSQIIGSYDAVINPSDKFRTGLYISRELFNEMKRISSAAKES